MELITTGVPNFRLVGDFFLLRMGVWGFAFVFSQHGLVVGWLIAEKDYPGWGVGSQKRIVCFKGFIKTLSFNLIQGQMMSLYHL